MQASNRYTQKVPLFIQSIKLIKHDKEHWNVEAVSFFVEFTAFGSTSVNGNKDEGFISWNCVSCCYMNLWVDTNASKNKMPPSSVKMDTP
jgi:hypothetical protein